MKSNLFFCILVTIIIHIISEQCIILDESDPQKPYSLTVHPNKKESSVTLSFHIKNKCKLHQEVKNLFVNIIGWSVDSHLIRHDVTLDQQGPNVLKLDVPNFYDNSIKFVINTEPCESEHCDKVKIPPGQDYKFTLVHKVKGNITQSTIDKLSLDYITSTNPGSISLTIDAERTPELERGITVAITDRTKISKRVTINTNEQKIKDVRFDGLPPNRYEIIVYKDAAESKDRKIRVTYTPSHMVNIIPDETNHAEVGLIARYAQATLVIEIDNIPELFTKEINATVKELNKRKPTAITFSHEEKEYRWENVKVLVGISININGIGIPDEGFYFKPIIFKDAIEPHDVEYPVVLFYEEDDNLMSIEFKIEGYEGLTKKPEIVIQFISATYNFEDLHLSKESSNIKLPKSIDIDIKVTEVTGFTITLSDNKIKNSTKKVNITVIPVKKKKIVYGMATFYDIRLDKKASSPEKHLLANISPYFKYVSIGYVSPSLKYTANSFDTTGLEFKNNFSFIKNVISLAKKKKKTTSFLLSVGGPWNSFEEDVNYLDLMKLLEDLDLDGIHLNFDDPSECTGQGTNDLSCTTDEKLIELIGKFRKYLKGKNLIVSLSALGAYGTEFNPHDASDAGMWVHPLKSVGDKIDILFLEGYKVDDADYDEFKAYGAYSFLTDKPIYLGVAVPDEETTKRVKKEVVLELTNKLIESEYNGGIFFDNVNKYDKDGDINDLAKPVCELFRLDDCDKTTPVKPK
jgi:hypothetical protein